MYYTNYIVDSMHRVILDKKQRDTWYNSYPQNGTKGYYAFGAKHLKCIKTPKGYRFKGEYLPRDTTIYRYGFPTYEFLTVPHGAFVYKCQVPGIDLTHAATIEEQIFPYSNTFLRRSTKYKLKVRCGKYYRVIMLKHKINTPFCYVFGTNIKLPTVKVPKWMRRNNQNCQYS